MRINAVRSVERAKRIVSKSIEQVAAALAQILSRLATSYRDGPSRFRSPANYFEKACGSSQFDRFCDLETADYRWSDCTGGRRAIWRKFFPVTSQNSDVSQRSL